MSGVDDVGGCGRGGTSSSGGGGWCCCVVGDVGVVDYHVVADVAVAGHTTGVWNDDGDGMQEERGSTG